jgi:hypothetical protein
MRPRRVRGRDVLAVSFYLAFGTVCAGAIFLVLGLVVGLSVETINGVLVIGGLGLVTVSFLLFIVGLFAVD